MYFSLLCVCVHAVGLVKALRLKTQRSVAEATATAVAGATASGGKQTITDHGDSFLTIRVDVGFQQLRMIPDSGSFDIYLIDGDDCRLDLCAAAYRPKFSRSHLQTEAEVRRDVYFGSGSCSVQLAYDSVRVHDDGTGSDFVKQVKQKQLIPLWKIDAMDDDLMAVWGNGGDFQGIIGLGFKGVSGRDSDELDREKEAAKQLQAPEPQEASARLFGAVFAICLPRGDEAKAIGEESAAGRATPADSGMLWWGAEQVPRSLQWRATVPVVGTRHWTAAISSATVLESPNGSAGAYEFCGAPCAALVDSGTSLIAMAGKMIDAILEHTEIKNLKEDCSNVNEMPDIQIKFGNSGNQEISISPESYVMKVSARLLSSASLTGRVTVGKNKHIVLRPARDKDAARDANGGPSPLRGLKESLLETEGEKELCTYAFMETPLDRAMVNGEEADVLILGIPIFREFVVKFDRDAETMSFAQHTDNVHCAELGNSETPAPTKTSLVQKSPDFKVRSLHNLQDLRFPASNMLP